MWPFLPRETFPYTNFHAMNQDWILKVVKDFQDQYTNIQQLIQSTTNEGLDELEAKKNQMEALLQQWYNTHSTDIANQLAASLVDIQEYAAGVGQYVDGYRRVCHRECTKGSAMQRADDGEHK